MRFFKNIMLVILGMALAVGIFCLIVGISCKINDLSFSQQIIEWFSSFSPAIKEPVDELVNNIALLKII